jgi:hypothetical protein
MADADDQDDQCPVTDLVEHAVFADSDPPESVAAAFEDPRAGGARRPGKVSNCHANALARRIR